MPNVAFTVEQAGRIIAALRPGESFVYHRGFVARDRGSRGDVGALADFMFSQGCPPNYLAGNGVAVDGHGAGTLTQRRVAPAEYEYIFIKTGRRGSKHMENRVYIGGGRAFASVDKAIAAGVDIDDCQEHRLSCPPSSAVFHVADDEGETAIFATSEEVVRWADGRGGVEIDVMDVA